MCLYDDELGTDFLSGIGYPGISKDALTSRLEKSTGSSLLQGLGLHAEGHSYKSGAVYFEQVISYTKKYVGRVDFLSLSQRDH